MGDIRAAALTTIFGFLLTAISCGYSAMDDRISKLEALVPTRAGQIAAIQANEVTTANSITRLERKIDWIIEHVALRKPSDK